MSTQIRSDNPAPILAANPEGIPAELRALAQWVGYRLEWQSERGKYSKAPINPGTGRPARTNDSATWGSLTAALAYAEAHGCGAGFVFSPADPYFGIDLDGCRNPLTGELTSEATALVERFATYAEISVSGCGLHLIGRGVLPAGGHRGSGVEVYDRLRFFAITGVTLPGYETINDCGPVLADWHREAFPPKSKPKAPTSNAVTVPSTPDDVAILGRVRQTAKGQRLLDGDISGYPSHSEADLALANALVAAGADRNQVDALYRASALYRPKWDHRHHADGRTYGQATIDRAFDGTVRPLRRGDNPPGPRVTASRALPADVATLQAMIVDLTARLAAAEARADAEAERSRRLSLLQSKTMSALRSPHLGSEKLTGVALALELANQQTAFPERTEFEIPADRLAEHTGMSAATIGGHLRDRLSDLVDHETGEVVQLFGRTLRQLPGGKTQSIYSATMAPAAMLEALATAVPASGKAKNGHGGRADRAGCPDHPGAAIVKRTKYVCGDCGRIVASDPDIIITPATTDEGPMLQDATSVAATSAPPAPQHPAPPIRPNVHLATSVPAAHSLPASRPNVQDATSVLAAPTPRPNVQDATSVPITPPVVNVYRGTDLHTYHNEDRAEPPRGARQWITGPPDYPPGDAGLDRWTR